MTMTRKTLLLLLAGIMIAGSLAGCKEDAPPSLWDPNYVDESWVHEPMKVLPLLRQWIAE